MREITQDNLNFLTNHRKIKYVERLAGSYKLRPYNNADHQYFVGVMYCHFAKIEGIDLTVEILEKVFCHDMMELYTGDLLYPAKNLNGKTKELWHALESEIVNQIPLLQNYSDKAFHDLMTIEQWQLFKACDLLELWCFCIEEMKLGNQSDHNRKVIDKCEEILDDPKMTFKSIEDFMNHFRHSI